ncbi:transketolase [bacterium]|nr:transketolase [bacterium]
MNTDDKKILARVADTIRVLSAEAIEEAKSGHPGLPLGCAELGACLFSRVLRHNPANPLWPGRDRFILSAGHGSMFLYSLLHLTGYEGVTIDQLSKFRRLGSHTPGHPELGETAGVEVTTGPLGQGVGMAIGMAIAQKWLAARFGDQLFDSKIFCLAGDGDMMEGISHESAALAGHLGLHHLVMLYDSNRISLDGPTSENMSEDTAARFRAYGFAVQEIDGHDFDQLESALAAARAEKERPSLVIVHTMIGRGAPKKQGTSEVHGAALGADELKGLKAGLGWPDEKFFVPAEVTQYFESLKPAFAKYEAEWNDLFNKTIAADPAKKQMWDTFANKTRPADFDEQIWNMPLDAGKATRVTSGKVLNKVAELLAFFISGSADLAVSDNSAIKNGGVVSRDNFMGRTFKFGVREFMMAAACNGMSAHGMIQPLCATFFTFSDYMRNAIRITSIMKQHVLYQFTHDTILLGEDGPTHQPVEQLAGLRAMPGITVFRPCDENEVKAAWIESFKCEGPVAFILSRQGIASQGELTLSKAREGVARGGYILHGEAGDCDVIICAAGSEVGTSMGAAKLLEAEGLKVRVVSLPCWNRFDAQPEAYRMSVLGGKAKVRVSVEAASPMGWHKYIGYDGLTIAMETFGVSAPLKEVADYFGFTPEKVAAKIKTRL